MSKVMVFSSKGVKKQSINFPKRFMETNNLPLLAQAIRVYEDRKHFGLAKKKTRGEVSLSTKKVWKQKGTGRARHGARSAPIFVGGGLAHGPRGKKRELVLPKKIRRKALKIALSNKVKDNAVVFVDSISGIKKTKEASVLIEKVTKALKKESKKTRISFILSEENRKIAKLVKNIHNLRVYMFKNLNAHNVYFGGILLIDKDILKTKTKKKDKEI